MRDNFPGRYRPTGEAFDQMWAEGLFVLDANVLLNLYRYSYNTRQQLVAVLRGLEDRLWLPHQVAYEFLNRRLGVIHDKRQAYEKLQQHLLDTAANVEERIEQLHRDQAVEAEEHLKDIRRSLETLVTYLTAQESELPKESNSPDDDAVWRIVDELYAGRIGDPYSSDRREKIFEEGRKRYDEAIPPGYEDEKKVKKRQQQNGESDQERQFGDLLVWFQILDKAKEAKKPIIFVTDDRKGDWWWIFSNQRIGPRPELVEEIHDQAQVNFYMYRPDRFMIEAGRRLDLSVSDEAIDEAQELKSLEDTERRESDLTEETPSTDPSIASSDQPRSRVSDASRGLDWVDSPEAQRAREWAMSPEAARMRDELLRGRFNKF